MEWAKWLESFIPAHGQLVVGFCLAVALAAVGLLWLFYTDRIVRGSEYRKLETKHIELGTDRDKWKDKCTDYEVLVRSTLSAARST